MRGGRGIEQQYHEARPIATPCGTHYSTQRKPDPAPCHTHAMRWHVAHNTVGRGHLYQGRFKSFPVEGDEYFLTVCRYVERNTAYTNFRLRQA